MNDLRDVLLILLIATVLGTLAGVAAGALVYWWLS